MIAHEVEPVVRDFLLMPADDGLPEGQKAYSGSKLLLAADLADHRGPREELRAAELLSEVADERNQEKE